MSKQQVAIIDYGMGNLHSVANAVKRASNDQFDVIVTSDSKIIENADRLVLPGQGAARDCMQAFTDNDLVATLNTQLVQKPSLGICMGLQVLMQDSTENGGIDCLGLIKGHCQGFALDLVDQDERLKVPAMGWNKVYQQQHPLWHGIDDGSYFYYAHSYYVSLSDTNAESGYSFYGQRFTASISQGTLFASQFHPEKSADNGLKLMANFLQWTPN